MDTQTIVLIVGALVLAYLVFKFVISPILKIIGTLLVVIIILAVLKNVFNVSFNEWLGPYAATFNLDQWLSGLSWLAQTVTNYVIWLFNFLKNLSQYLPQQPTQ